MRLDWTMFGTGPEMVRAFSKKEIEVGYMGLPPATIGIDKGIPIKCVAGGHVEGTIMVGKNDYKNLAESNNSHEEVLSQYKGKSIGVTSKGSIHDVIINHYLEKTNLQDEIELKNYDQAEYIALDLKKNVIEAGVGTPSLATFASTLLDSRIVIPPNSLWAYNPSYGVFFYEDLIKDQPEIVRKFVIHHKEASALLRNSPSRVAKLVANIFKIIDDDYVRAVLKISPKYCAALPDEYVTATMQFVKVLHKLKYIQKELKISEIFNFDFVNEIHPGEHHYKVPEN